MLTEDQIKRIVPSTKRVRHFDANSLYLEVTPAGAKSWRLKYVIEGKDRRLTLGAWPEITLKQARLLAFKAKQNIADGGDPAKEKQQAKLKGFPKTEPILFAEAFRQWYDHWSVGKNERHSKYVYDQMMKDVVSSVIGSMPLDAINAQHIVGVVKSIEARGVGDLARRLLARTQSVFKYAIANGNTQANPAAGIQARMILKPVTVKHMARVPVSELPELVRKIDDYDQGYGGDRLTAYALKFMLLTFVRTQEMTLATWDEFSDEFWMIPADRMKMPTSHIVPLSSQTKELLAALKAENYSDKYVFPGDRRGAMSSNTILFALYRMGYRGRQTGHGFRGLASTVLHESGFPHEHIELQLAHQERSSVSAAYNYAQYVPQRAQMMQWWADYLDTCRKFAKEPNATDWGTHGHIGIGIDNISGKV